MGRVAILGGGVAGMSAALILSEKGYDGQIDLYTDAVGGNYLKGGLKYLHFSAAVVNFVSNILKMDYRLYQVAGSILWKGQIHQYPGWMWYSQLGVSMGEGEGKEAQRSYYKKTRGEGAVNTTCMNDPWNFRNHIKLVPNGGMKGFVERMAIKTENAVKIVLGKLDSEKFRDVITRYDMVIYTLPISMLARFLNSAIKFEYNSLNIIRYEIFSGRGQFWMDYTYVPGPEYRFHRVSIDGNTLDFEINGELGDEEIDESSVECGKFVFRHFNGVKAKEKGFNTGIPGQLISPSQNLSIPKNVVLLGRFAQWDGRMTLDKVIERAGEIADKGFVS